MKIAPVLTCALATLLTGSDFAAQGRPAASVAHLQTRAERSAYQETSRYADVIAFLQALAQAAPKTVQLTTFGYTLEGRALPLAVVGAPDASPESVRRTGKLRVYIQGNIHGGEVEGKESALMLLRELAQGRHAEWLQSMVLLVAPVFNADGNERVSLTNRGRQHGPVGGMGQRPNAQDLDLNRDHMKLDSPEARSVVKLMNDYDPHVSMDLHTTNGSYHAYHLTYAPPLNPATDPAIIGLLRNEWLPQVTKTIKSKHGWDFYYYGNVGGRGGGGRPGGPGRGASGGGRGAPTGTPPTAPEGSSAVRSWTTFDHRPRFNNNYIGLRNRIAILSEAYAYATFEDRIRATSRFIEENLNFAHANARRIQQLLAGADKADLAGSMLAVRSEIDRSPEPVEILMGEVTEEKNPYSGQMMLRRLDVRRPESMIERGTFKASLSEAVPAAYFIPPSLRTVIDRLEAHGVTMTALTSTETRAVEEFRVESVDAAPRPFQNRTERTLRGSWAPAERQLPAGTVRVDMRQPLARLVFCLIEPMADDSLANWNLVDGLEPGAKVYPILRER